MALIVEERKHPRDGYRLQLTERGWQGVRVYHVNTPDLREAVEAPGVPQIGAVWPGFTTLRARTADASLVVGEKPAGSGVSGWTKVSIAYSDPELARQSGGELVIPREAQVLGASFTEFEFQDGSTTVYEDTTGNRLLGDQGAAIPVGTMELRVLKYLSRPPEPALIATLLARVNDAQFTMPAFYGAAGPSYTIPAGSVVFLAPGVRRIDEGLFEVSYRFAHAQDWKDRRSSHDADGAPVGPIVVSDVIPTFDTAALLALLNSPGT